MLGTYPKTPALRTAQGFSLEVRFPPLPRTVADVSMLIAQQTDVPDTPRLVHIVNADPVMAAAVLRRINSAYFGVRHPIGDLQKAVFLLGFLDVCNVVLMSAMFKLTEILKSKRQLKLFEQLMQFSVGSARFAQELAESLRLPMKETAFTMGLLHSVGRLVLLYNRPNDYEALWSSADAVASEHPAVAAPHQGAFPTAEAEQGVFGTDHTEMGERAAAFWKLPEDIGRVIRHYLMPGHLPEGPLRTLALTVAVSASATEQLCLPRSEGKLRFEAKTALRILSRTANISSDTLINLILSKQYEVTSYMQSMVIL